MTKDEIKAKVLQVLGEIAPEANLAKIKPDVNFRDQVDIDSMDYLNFVIALDEELKLEIPERDYTKFNTLAGCVGQIETLLASRQKV